ncbi:MAG: terminase small subunit [Alphaproteobacteria bacterium]|nr:terminase small subunit [Alphaproteobacteria bacterium]
MANSTLPNTLSSTLASIPKNLPKLTPKQLCFCHEYMVDLNGTKAAMRAGYSRKTANEQAARLLANVSIVGIIDILIIERIERIQITSDDVMRRLDDLYHRAHEAKKFNVAIAALTAIGKHIGYFPPEK